MSKLVSWTPDKAKEAMRNNQEESLTIHLVLDRSTSMKLYESNLIEAAQFYLDELKDDTPFLTHLELTTFAANSRIHGQWPMWDLPDGLLHKHYKATGSLTALNDAIYRTLLAHSAPGQRMLIVFTDGEDNASETKVDHVRTLMETLQEKEGWLCVFLGVYTDALATGVALGFPVDNCLVFPSRDIPKAFGQLLRSTKRYLEARKTQDVKLLTSGFFA